MAHVREQIRNRFATLLSALAGGRVYTTRFYPFDVLPAIGIFANAESSSLDPTTAVNRLNRYADVVVEVATEAVADVDAALDVLASSIESQIASDPNLSGLAAECTLVATSIQTDDGGDVPLAFARLTFRVWYRTTAANPDVAI